jgi:hypothetical protein
LKEVEEEESESEFSEESEFSGVGIFRRSAEFSEEFGVFRSFQKCEFSGGVVGSFQCES